MTCPNPSDQQTLLQFLTDEFAPEQLNLGELAEEQLVIAVRRLNAHLGRQVLPGELSKSMILTWLKSLANKGQAPATINGKRAAILQIWQAAHSAKKAPEPPRKYEIPLKRSPRRLPNSWTVAQMSSILDGCSRLRGTFKLSGITKADFLTSLVLFDYDTGTRLTASLQVRTEDLNLDTGTVYLRWEAAKTGIEQVHWLSEETLTAIRKHWDPQREFVWPFGPNKHSLWDALREVLKGAGLPSDRRSMFHRFRRTTATILTGRAGIAAASAALGHTSEAMTRKYVDPTNLPTSKAIDILPRLRVSG